MSRRSAPWRSASTLLSQWPVAPLPVVPEVGPEEPPGAPEPVGPVPEPVPVEPSLAPGVAPGLMVLSPDVLSLLEPVLSLPLALLASFGGRS